MLVRERLVSAREKKNLSSSQMAHLLGITSGTYTRYENGTIKRIPTKQLAKISDILGVSFDDLYDEDPQYNDRIESESRNMTFEMLTEDEAKLVVWYRDLSNEERSIVKQVRSLKPGH